MAKIKVPGGHMVGVLPAEKKPKPEKPKPEKPEQSK